jgi:hypothetical protein
MAVTLTGDKVLLDESDTSFAGMVAGNLVADHRLLAASS